MEGTTVCLAVTGQEHPEDANFTLMTLGVHPESVRLTTT